MSDEILEGVRVTLRPVENRDLGFLMEQGNRDEVRIPLQADRFNFRTSLYGRILRFLRSFICRTEERADFIAVVSGERVGGAGVSPIDRERETGRPYVWIVPEMQGRGFGLEAYRLVVEYAFENLGLYRLEGRTLQSNQEALNMAERLGGKKEGVGREAGVVDGEREDMIFHGLLRHEWEEIRDEG